MQFNVSGDAENMYTALGVKLAAGVTPTQAVTDSLIAAMRLPMLPFVSSDYVFGPGHMIWGQDGGDIRIDGSASLVNGTAGAGPLAPNSGVLIRKLTALGGRRQRGRMYIPGTPEGSVSAAGFLTGAYLTTVTTGADPIRTGLRNTAEVEEVVLLHNVAPFTPTTITSLEGQTKIATQRRRLRP